MVNNVIQFKSKLNDWEELLSNIEKDPNKSIRYKSLLLSLIKEEQNMPSLTLLKQWFDIKNKIRKVKKLLDFI